MSIANKLGRFLYRGMNRVLPIEELLQEKAELEDELKAAQNGEYSNTEEAIAEITEDLNQVKAAIARRRR